jgi:sugar/nucleoside kinase (ribokinase family)
MTGDEYFHLPALPCEVVDTTGAGDVFHGAYIIGLLRRWDVRQTARFATAVSALKCGSLGGRSGIPAFDQVIDFLKHSGYDVTPYVT